MTWPSTLIKAPPELPGLIAASVWIALTLTVSLLSFRMITLRDRLEMMPSVAELAYSLPRGEPIAIAGSPTVSLDESPNSATFVTSFDEILMTAKSL